MKTRLLTLFLLSLLALSAGCSQTKLHTVEDKYDQAVELMDKGQYSQVTPVLLELIKENPGTRYSTYAHLLLADSWMGIGGSAENYDAAETQYRIFLANSPGSHLVPYVLSQLIELNYLRNVSNIFSESYSFARDPGHFRKIVQEYQRFFLLYPDSLYLVDAKKYLALAERALAMHEFLIGNWYLKTKHYPSAISRYQHTLKEFPNFEGRQQVLEKLIYTYNKNQQPLRAQEMQRIYQQHFN